MWTCHFLIFFPAFVCELLFDIKVSSFCSNFNFFLPSILHVGLRSSALLALLLSNDSSSDSELCPVSPESSQELSTATDTSSLPGSTAAICSPTSPKDKVRKRRCGVKWGIMVTETRSQYSKFGGKDVEIQDKSNIYSLSSFIMQVMHY